MTLLALPFTGTAERSQAATAPLPRVTCEALDDAELAHLTAQGRTDTFRELVRRYERPVFSLICRMVRQKAVAEDLAQEVFLRVYQSIGTYRSRYKFSSWIFKIAHNLTIDHLRKRTLDTVSVDGSPHAETPEEAAQTRVVLEDRGESPAEFVENQELGEEIEKAIDSLRPEYRMAILLRHVEGRAYNEIAEIMDLPLGTVKTYLHRARGELREMLEGYLS